MERRIENGKSDRGKFREREKKIIRGFHKTSAIERKNIVADFAR